MLSPITVAGDIRNALLKETIAIKIGITLNKSNRPSIFLCSLYVDWVSFVCSDRITYIALPIVTKTTTDNRSKKTTDPAIISKGKYLSNILLIKIMIKLAKIIDNLIQTQFKPKRYIKSLQDLFEQNNLSKKEISNLEIIIANAIKDKKKPEKEKFLKTTNNNVELVTKILSLTNVIIKFFQ